MGKGSAQIWLLLTLSLKGILAGNWSVQLPSSPICAVIGSSVVLPCSYDYPQSSRKTSGAGQLITKATAGIEDGGGEEEQQYKVLSEVWCRDESRCITPRYVFHSAGIFPDTSFQNRVEYLGKPGTKNCSLRISELKQSDSGTYVFYLITNHTTQKMPGQNGIQLLVADSSSAVAVSKSPSSDITEGMSLSLACCSPAASPHASPHTHLRWFKKTSVTSRHHALWNMDEVTSENSGSYYCQIQTRDKVQNSELLNIDVQYPPQNTSISVVPAGDRPEELTVTLTCSSDANPAVQTYTWYQGSACPTTPENGFHQGREFLFTPTGKGQTLSTDAHGQFCCVASNKHGSQMCTVTLSASSASTGKRMLIVVGLSVAALVALIALVAFIMMRRQKPSSHQSYVLSETSDTAP
ncbi:hypothetical protein LDENG_00033270 [Lucifuga dentata]|nr:hypothetical protein LDENG_00033270 [Lucifuga dentata]